VFPLAGRAGHYPSNARFPHGSVGCIPRRRAAVPGSLGFNREAGGPLRAGHTHGSGVASLAGLATQCSVARLQANRIQICTNEGWVSQSGRLRKRNVRSRFPQRDGSLSMAYTLVYFVARISRCGMAIRNGQKKINPESDRGAERKRPSPARSQRTPSRCNFELPNKKAYCGETAG
jgi:hypothetical protein